MRKCLLVSAIFVTAALICSSSLRAQDDKWNMGQQGLFGGPNNQVKPGPAPKRDISGLWAAVGGVGAKGPREYPDDPAHVGKDVPYTAAGKAARLKNKPGEGEQQYPAEQVNDPVNACDPEGFPRIELYEFRLVQLIQTPKSVLFVNQFGDNWRKIWTDGRELPKDAEPRWNGYSVGHWEDDYTFVVETIGSDDRSWLDNVGRPHSDAMKVTERFHRVDSNNMVLTLTIDDPKYYTQPWQPIKNLQMRLLPDDFDMTEIICSPTEVEAYNKTISEGHSQDNDIKHDDK